MKQMLSVLSNDFYTSEGSSKEFALNAMLELVIIHTDGKDYKVKGSELIATGKLNEIRLIVNPELLSVLITELQLHQKKLENARKNAEQLNALIKHINTK